MNTVTNPWADNPEQKTIPLNINRADLPNESDLYVGQVYPTNNIDPHVDIENALRDANLVSSSGIIIDGSIHRIADISKPGDRTGGWYVFNEVSNRVIFGNFGSWISGYKGEYSSIDQNVLTIEQKTKFELCKIEDQRKYKAEQERKWVEAATIAERVFNDGKEVDDFQYLINKKLPGTAMISQSNGYYIDWMMVPVFDENNNISTVQFINENGDKRFLSGGRKKGCCHMVPGDNSEIYIVEGYVTGLTVAKATGSMVAVAFDAGNLEAVAKAINKKYSNSNIVIAGDNDHEKEKNAGKNAAEKVAGLIGARVETPPSIIGVSDFNDLYIEQGIDAVVNVFDNSLKELFSARPVKVSDFEGLLPRQFLSGKHLIRGFVSATIAPPGVGKSTLSMQEAIGLATSTQTTSNAPKKRLRVLLINLEDGLDEMRIRVAGMCKHYSVDLSHLEGWLFLNSGRDNKLKIAEYGDRGKVTINPVVEAIKATIIENRIDVLIIDPFVRTHYVDENSNKDVDLVMEEFTRIAEETNCAIDLVHHTSKPPRGSGNYASDANQARGASAFIGAVRSARILAEMNDNEAKDSGVEKDDRRWHLRVDNVKSNLTPPSSGGDWYKRISVKTDYKDEEGMPVEIGVLEEWSPQDIKNILFSDDQLTKISLLIQNGLPNGDKYSRNSQATKRWFGFALADMYEKDPVKDKRYLTNIIKNLIESNILAEVEIKTTGRDAGRGLYVVDQNN